MKYKNNIQIRFLCFSILFAIIMPLTAQDKNAEYWFHKGVMADSLSNFKRAIEVEPNNSESHNNYGSFLCARSRYDESIKEFLAAVKNPLYATPAMAYTNAGICSMRKKDIVNAEAYLLKALQLEPLSGMAAYQLATLQFNRNDVPAAKKTLQNVMLGQSGPELLWLAIQIERAVGARDAEASYALQLRRQYPDSEQARLLQSGK